MIVSFLLLLSFGVKECVSGCIEIDMKRIRVLKTLDDPGITEEWRIGPNGFKITFNGRFISRGGWDGCIYAYSGAFLDANGDPCTPPANNQNDDGFYNCYMDIPSIIVGEETFDAGLSFTIDGQVGDYDISCTDMDDNGGECGNCIMEFDNGPCWDYSHTFTPSYDEVKNAGTSENYATRYNCDGDETGRRGRHFFKYTYRDGSQDECTIDIDRVDNDLFECGTDSSILPGADFEFKAPSAHHWKWNEYISVGTLIGFGLAIAMTFCVLCGLKLFVLSSYKKHSYSKVDYETPSL